MLIMPIIQIDIDTLNEKHRAEGGGITLLGICVKEFRIK
jgi:hypothetical protein